MKVLPWCTVGYRISTSLWEKIKFSFGFHYWRWVCFGWYPLSTLSHKFSFIPIKHCYKFKKRLLLNIITHFISQVHKNIFWIQMERIEKIYIYSYIKIFTIFRKSLGQNNSCLSLTRYLPWQKVPLCFMNPWLELMN